MGKHDFYLELKDKKGREDLFASVTNIKEFIILKLNVLEILLSQWAGKRNSQGLTFPYLHVEDKKLHRVFIVSNNKIVSFGFRFTIKTMGDTVEFLICKNERFNTKDISDAHAIVNMLREDDLYKELSFEDENDIPGKEGIKLFEYLLFEEPSYLRYDFDKNASKGNRYLIHPTHHLDFCFTPSYTYKLGLASEINETEFKEILLASDCCRFLSLKQFEHFVYIKHKYKKSRNRFIVKVQGYKCDVNLKDSISSHLQSVSTQIRAQNRKKYFRC